MDVPVTKLGLILLWADAQGYTDFVPPHIARKGVIGKWRDARPQPDEATIRAAGTDQQARSRYKILQDEEASQREVDRVVYKVIARLYKELSPDTPNTQIRSNVRRWIRQSR